MTARSLTSAGLAPVPRTLAWQAAAVLLGTLALAASSHVSVPMFPVPMTLQTLAVTLIGALFGWRLAVVTVFAWLLQGAAGLPVFAPGGAPGLARFAGPTAGYLFAFPIAAALVGWLAERGWNGTQAVRAFAAMLAGNVLCLAVGGIWLAASVGAEKAWLVGVAPFVVGALLKSVLGAAVLVALRPLLTRR